MRFAVLVLALVSAVSFTTNAEAAFVYTTSINYGNVPAHTQQTFLDSAGTGAIVYTQTAVSTETVLLGNSNIKIGDQLLSLTGTAGGFDTTENNASFGHPENVLSYNINILNQATGAFKVIKIGVGTVGTYGNAFGAGSFGATLTSIYYFQPQNPRLDLGLNNTVVLDGVTFTVNLPLAGGTGPQSYGGSFPTPTIKEFDVTLNVSSTIFVPEPSSIIMVSLGGLGVAVASWRRRRRVA